MRYRSEQHSVAYVSASFEHISQNCLNYLTLDKREDKFRHNVGIAYSFGQYGDTIQPKSDSMR